MHGRENQKGILGPVSKHKNERPREGTMGEVEKGPINERFQRRRGPDFGKD